MSLWKQGGGWLRHLQEVNFPLDLGESLLLLSGHRNDFDGDELLRYSVSRLVDTAIGPLT